MAPLRLQADHGGSAGCDDDPEADPFCHATARVDLYFLRLEGERPLEPLLRSFAIFDVVGSGSPYFCHPHHEPDGCSAPDPAPE